MTELSMAEESWRVKVQKSKFSPAIYTNYLYFPIRNNYKHLVPKENKNVQNWQVELFDQESQDQD